jgi:anaerobic magnesium-protoporphyrin IX monomethyl ester cyclase
MKKIKSLNIKEIYFSDKSFGIPLDNTKNLLNGMIHSQFNFSWSTYMHPNQFTENFLDLMKQAGCHTIIIGIESANFFSLKKYGRIVDENKTRQLILYANKIGVNVCGDFMIGLPGELITDVERTIQLSTELNLDYASFNIVTPLPGTEIKRLALADGRLKLGQHNFDSTGYNNTLDSDTLLKEELLKLRRKAVLKFYLRPKYIFSRLRKIRGYEHILIQAEEMLSLILNMFRY